MAFRLPAPTNFALAAFALGALTLVAGCQPKIGDACNTSTDCSTQGDRLCDTTQPGGYCTIFNCEPNTCPEDEAACVAFNVALDPACGAADDGKWPRFERSFCMAFCEDDSDCRSGYECVAPSERSALIVDDDRSAKVCLAEPYGATATPPATPPEACLPPEDYDVDAGADGGGGGP